MLSAPNVRDPFALRTHFVNFLCQFPFIFTSVSFQNAKHLLSEIKRFISFDLHELKHVFDRVSKKKKNISDKKHG